MKRFLFLFYIFIGITKVGLSQTNQLTDKDFFEKAKRLQKLLSLTNVQTNKLAAIFKDASQKFERLKINGSGNVNKLTAAIAPLRTQTINKINVVLTPEQEVKFDKLIREIDGSPYNIHPPGRVPLITF